MKYVLIPQILRYYGFQTYGTINSLGMKYCKHKKNYCVDGHEGNDVVLSRWIFEQYYMIFELKMSLCIQITKEERIIMEMENEIAAESEFHFSMIRDRIRMSFMLMLIGCFKIYFIIKQLLGT